MERLGSGLSFFYFVLNLPPLTRDVTCSLTLLEREIHEEEMSDEHPLMQATNHRKGNFPRGQFPGEIVRGQLLINFPGAIIRSNFPRGHLPGGQFSSGAIILWGNCLVSNNQEEAGNHPGGNCSGGANFPRKQSSRHHEVQIYMK